jgi:hypothetical protein
MDNAVQTITQSISLSSLLDLGLCIGVICALGVFLLYKGKMSALSKR